MTQVQQLNAGFKPFLPFQNGEINVNYPPIPFIIEQPQDSFVNNTTVTPTQTVTDQLAMMMAKCLDSMRSVPVLNQFVPESSVKYADTFTPQVCSVPSSYHWVEKFNPMIQIANMMANTSVEATAEASEPRTIKVSDKVEKYDSIIQEKAQKYGLDPDFVKCVIQQESGGRAEVKSHCGAMGLMQLMPDTAEWLGCENPLDPEQNIDAGCKYLARLLKSHNGDLKLALASYNAGPGNVRKYGGIPPFAETQNYVANIINNYEGIS